MIILLYHATIYYKIRKYIQEAQPDTLTYEMVIEKAKAHERNCLEYKDHQASQGGANSVPSYNNPLLSAHAIGRRRKPSGQNLMLANGVANVANPMSEAIVLLMGKHATSVRVLIIFKQSVVQRLQLRQVPALTRRSHNRMPGDRRPAATMAKEVANSSSRRRCQRSSLQSREHTPL